MRQKLLSSFRLRVVMLVAILCSAFTGTVWGEDTYTKVTTAPSDWSGTYVIVADESNVIFTGKSGSNNYGGYASVTISNNSVTGNFSAYEVEVEASGSYYSIKHKNSSNYLGWTSGNNLYFSTNTPSADTYRWVLSTSSILNANDNNRKLQYNSGSPRFACYTSSQKVAYLYKKETSSSTSTCATPTFSPAAGTYTSAQNVTISTETSGATIYYTIDGTEPTANSSVYSSAISVSSDMTIKAMAVANGYDNSAVATAAYTIVSLAHAGTAADPYSVADAYTAIDVNVGLTEVYATGIVSAIPTAWSSEHSNITFNIVDNSGDTDFLQAFRCVSTTDADASTVAVGDIVVVKGNLTKYGNTYEFGQGCQLVSLTHPTVPVINADNVNIAYNAISSAIEFTIDNSTQDGVLTAAITAGNEGNWLSLGTVSTTVPLTCSANEGNADRTATVTLTYTYDTNKTVTKVVTVTQKHYVNVYNGTGTFNKVTTLADLEDGGYYVIYSTKAMNSTLTSGAMGVTDVTPSNNAITNPATSIVWKLEANGDNWNLYNEDIEKYCFINGNNTTSFATGATSTYSYIVTVNNEGGFTFKSTHTNSRCISLSSDGSSFRSFAASNNPTVELYKLGQASTNPSITVTPATVNALASAEAPATEIEGTLSITYTNLPISVMTDFDIQFCNSEGNALTQGNEPDWIMTDVAEEQGGGYVVSYIMEENDGAARTAYFKVYALDNDLNEVYSNLVTVTQAAYVAPFQATTWTLATAITSGKHYIITNGTAKAVGLQNNNNRAAVDVTIDNVNGTATVNSADVFEFVAYGPDANGKYTLYDVTNDGYLYAASTTANHLKTQSTNNANGKWAITISEGVATIIAQGDHTHNELRYNSSGMFSCYESVNSQDDVYLFEKENDTPVTTKASVTLNGYGYATFASASALDFLDSEKASYSAWQITGVSGENITFDQIDNHVAAGKGILLKGTPNATITLNVLPAGGATLSGNKLVGITTATEVSANQYYGLSGNQFKKVNAGTIPAGKALLPASVAGNAARLSFVFEDDTTTGIYNVNVNPNDNKVYDLSGRRVTQPTKGLYIVNGKKVVK